MLQAKVGPIEEAIERELDAISGLVDQTERIIRADKRFAMNSEAIGYSDMDTYEDEEMLIDWILWDEAE